MAKIERTDRFSDSGGLFACHVRVSWSAASYHGARAELLHLIADLETRLAAEHGAAEEWTCSVGPVARTGLPFLHDAGLRQGVHPRHAILTLEMPEELAQDGDPERFDALIDAWIGGCS